MSISALFSYTHTVTLRKHNQFKVTSNNGSTLNVTQCSFRVKLYSRARKFYKHKQIQLYVICFCTHTLLINTIIDPLNSQHDLPVLIVSPSLVASPAPPSQQTFPFSPFPFHHTVTLHETIKFCFFFNHFCQPTKDMFNHSNIHKHPHTHSQ